jgi:hypothetical protein
VKKSSSEPNLSFSPAQIAALTYEDLASDRKRLLNLKPPAALGELLHS